MKKISILVLVAIIGASCVTPKVYKELETKYAYVKKENRELSKENESLLNEKNREGVYEIDIDSVEDMTINF